MKALRKSMLTLMLLSAMLFGMVLTASAEENTGTATLTLRQGAHIKDYSETESTGVVYVLAVAGMIHQGEPIEGMDNLVVFYDEDENMLFVFDKNSGLFGYGSAYHDIHLDLTEEVKNQVQTSLDTYGAGAEEAMVNAVQEIINNYSAVELLFAPLHSLIVETEYGGFFAYAREGEELVYEEESLQNYYTTMVGIHLLGAKANEGYSFLKWVRILPDGSEEDYSTQPEITVDLQDEDIELRACFMATPWDTATLTLRNGAPATDYTTLETVGVIYVLGAAGKLYLADSPEGFEQIQFYNDENHNLIFLFDEESQRFGYGTDYHDIILEISDELRAELRQQLEMFRDGGDTEFLEILQNIVDYYIAVELLFAPSCHIAANTEGDGHLAVSIWDQPLSYKEEDLVQSFYSPYVGSHTLGAVAAEGWQFEKWTNFGEDYATEPEITVDLWEENYDLVAVFTPIPTGVATLTLRNGATLEDYSVLESVGVVYVLGAAGKLHLVESPEGFEHIQIFNDEDDNMIFLFNEEGGIFGYGTAYHEISLDISRELREELRTDLELYEKGADPEFLEVLADIIDNYQRVELAFAPLSRLTVTTRGNGYISVAEGEEELSYLVEDLFQSYYSPYIGSYQLGAAAADGWQFVKWIKDGKDYDTLSEICIELDEVDIVLTAVFEVKKEPATEPPATEPPTTQPPATEPPATEPPATQPATPPMGDESSLLLWGLLLMTGLSAAVLLVGKKKS